MRTLKNVYDRIAESDKKTELASEKVELGIIEDKTELTKHEVALGIADDVKAAYKKAIAARKESVAEYSKVQKIVAQALKAQQDFKKINEDAITLFNKYEAAAKELGLPLPGDVKNAKKNIADGLKGTFVLYIKALKSAKL